jgi:GNAT superfamily N-acetyltransferase
MPLHPSLHVSPTCATHANQLEELQKLVFPTLADDERLKACHYLKHIEMFPDGQFVVLDGELVVGMTTTIRLHFDFDHIDHTFADIIVGGWCTTHKPDGGWLYGIDVGVHPAYRGRGIGKALYDARQGVVNRLGLKGQVTVGMMSGFKEMKSRLSALDYYQKLVAGEIWDPTVSMQIKTGFKPRGLLPGYVNDPLCDNWGVLLVWESEAESSGMR